MAGFLERQFPVSLQEAGDFGIHRGCYPTPTQKRMYCCVRSLARERGDLTGSVPLHSATPPSLCLCVCICVKCVAQWVVLW